MIQKLLLDKLEKCPIITAVKNHAEFMQALETENELVFILYGSLQTISGITSKIHEKGKLAIVHMDLIDGLSSQDAAVKFLADTVKVDGIISTKSSLLRCAKERGLITVQRFFLLDSLSLKKLDLQENFDAVDLVEILPGVMPKIIKKVCLSVCVPVIAGGLIQDKEDVMQALASGAAGVSSTNAAIWNM